MLHVFIVGRFQRARRDRVVDRKNHVTGVDLRIVHDGHHRIEAPLRNIEYPAKVAFQVRATDHVGWQSGSAGYDRGGKCVAIQDFLRFD